MECKVLLQHHLYHMTYQTIPNSKDFMIQYADPLAHTETQCVHDLDALSSAYIKYIFACYNVFGTWSEDG